MTCRGKVARDAARYSKGLCRAVIAGMGRQMRSQGILRAGEVGLHAVDDEEGGQSCTHTPQLGYSGRYRDDVSGHILRDDLVQAARREELKYFYTKGVWIKRPKGEAKRMTGKAAISVRWVDVNKGGRSSPEVSIPPCGPADESPRPLRGEFLRANSTPGSTPHGTVSGSNDSRRLATVLRS